MQQGFRIVCVVFFFAALVAFVAPPALAGGFEVLEQGRGVGNANAGVRATADDPATVFWNPAGMTRFRCHAAALTASAIIPDADFVDEGSYRLLNPLMPFTGEAGNTDTSVFVGGLFGVWSLNQRWKIGLGVNVPFGLTTDWGRTWMGRYHATESELLTVNINPSVAYRINKCWSVAVGASAMYAEADLGSAIDFGAIALAPQTMDGHVLINGDGWGFGFNAGVLWEPSSRTRVGLTYRSQVTQDLEGTANYEVPAGAQGIVAATGRFVNCDATAKMTLPDTAGLSVYHELSSRWALLGDVTWTGWSCFDELRVKYANPNEPDTVTPENWNDTWRVALGVNYRPNRCWVIRLGTAWDQSPIEEGYRTPRIPGNDRIWASCGVGFTPHRNWTIDVFYTHVFVEEGDINLSSQAAGILNGHVESGVDIAGFQITWHL